MFYIIRSCKLSLSHASTWIDMDRGAWLVWGAEDTFSFCSIILMMRANARSSRTVIGTLGAHVSMQAISTTTTCASHTNVMLASILIFIFWSNPAVSSIYLIAPVHALAQIVIVDQSFCYCVLQYVHFRNIKQVTTVLANSKRAKRISTRKHHTFIVLKKFYSTCIMENAKVAARTFW